MGKQGIQLYSFIFISAFFLIFYLGGKVKSELKILSLSKLNAKEVHNFKAMTFEDQKKAILVFYKSICVTTSPCSLSTQQDTPDYIVAVCQKASKEVKNVIIPTLLPASVKEHLVIYRDSMKNSMNKLEEAYQKTQKGNLKGVNILNSFKNWEIDTCTEKSVPQKLLQFYGITRDLNLKVVTCDDLLKLKE